MKAEHRKELETNVLVDKLGRAYQGLKQGPSRGTVVFFGVVLLGVVLWGAWRYFSTSSARANSERWMKVDDAVFPAQLDGLVEDKEIQGTTQGRAARFKEARRQLRDGLRDLGGGGNEAAEKVRRGISLYEELLKESTPLPVLRQEALMGAAQGYEALGELDKARELYRRLADDKESAESALGKEAKKQLERLDDDNNKRDLEDLIKKLAPREDAGKD
jgi:hypothetical protein